MSDLVKELRNALLLIPMKGGGEMVTSLGVFAADRIEELEHMVKDINEFYENEIKKLEAAILKSYINRTAKNYIDFNTDAEAIEHFLTTNAPQEDTDAKHPNR